MAKKMTQIKSTTKTKVPKPLNPDKIGKDVIERLDKRYRIKKK